MKRQVPKMMSDEEAGAFLDQDLSDLDFSQFKPVKFEFRAKGQESVRFPPGSPAPQSGMYRQVGPRGGKAGDSVTIARGKPLPPAKKGRSWALVAAVQGDGED